MGQIWERRSGGINRVTLFRTLALVVLVFGAVPAAAESITIDGSIYTLTYAPYTPLGDNWYDVTLTIDATNYTGFTQAPTKNQLPPYSISAVAMKISNSIIGVPELVSAPEATDLWKVSLGGLNANGCSGTGAGFECEYTQIYGTDAPAAVPGVYDWTVREQIGGALLTGYNQATIKAEYVNRNGVKVGSLVSQSITLQKVPEPVALEIVLLSVVVGLLVWKRPSILVRRDS